MTQLFIVNNSSRAANYGIGTYIRQLAGCLIQRPGLKVSFIEMASNVKEYTLEEDERGCIHYRIPFMSNGMESEKACRCSFYFLARHIISDDKDGIVFQFNYFQHLDLAVLLKSRYINSKIVFTVHYFGWCFELKGNKRKFKEIIAKSSKTEDKREERIRKDFEYEKVFLHLCDGVMALSRDTRDILTEYYGVSQDKLHLVYNGLGSSLALDKKKNKHKDILFVGRLDEIKGLKYLISAFELIAKKRADARLIVVGDGDFQPYLKQGRNLVGRVAFLGKMTSEELEAVYQSAYIGVMPSFHEQCSYTAIEMMRHGIPLVGTDSTGLSEMLDANPQLRVHIDEENFNEKDFTSQIASRLDLLLSDDAFYKEASQAVCELYKERYTATKMTQGTISVLSEGSGSIVSPDFLPHIDEKMFNLIKSRPDIDLDFFGLTGIGVYLWWRAIHVTKEKASNENQLKAIKENLISFLDWVGEVIGADVPPNELFAMLNSMREYGFCLYKVEQILGNSKVAGEPSHTLSDQAILQNALKIITCKI